MGWIGSPQAGQREAGHATDGGGGRGGSRRSRNSLRPGRIDRPRGRSRLTSGRDPDDTRSGLPYEGHHDQIVSGTGINTSDTVLRPVFHLVSKARDPSRHKVLTDIPARGCARRQFSSSRTEPHWHGHSSEPRQPGFRPAGELWLQRVMLGYPPVLGPADNLAAGLFLGFEELIVVVGEEVLFAVRLEH